MVADDFSSLFDLESTSRGILRQLLANRCGQRWFQSSWEMWQDLTFPTLTATDGILRQRKWTWPGQPGPPEGRSSPQQPCSKAAQRCQTPAAQLQLVLLRIMLHGHNALVAMTQLSTQLSRKVDDYLHAGLRSGGSKLRRLSGNASQPYIALSMVIWYPNTLQAICS